MPKSFNPLVSIIIPVYNGSNFVGQAIDSALAQTYNNVEIVVVNDGSKDDTEKIIKEYGNKIKYYYKENGGVATALNLAVEKSKGEYISWLSHDDVYDKDKIKFQVSALNEGNKESVVFCDYKFIDAKGNFIADANLNNKSSSSILAFLALDTKTGLHGCSLLIPKSLFDKVGRFNPKLEITQDYDLWFRMAKRFPFIHVSKQLLLSRKHPDQDSIKKPEKSLKEADSIHARFIDELTDRDIDNYIEDDEYYLDIYYEFKNAGYKNTVRSLLKLFYRCNKFNNLRIKEFLNKEVFQNINESWLDSNIKNIKYLINSNKRKPRIVFTSNIWSRGGLERVITLISKELLIKYEIIIISNFEKENSFVLDNEIIKIHYVFKDKYVENLANLITQIRIDLLIGNPNHDVEFLRIYQLLRNENIKTIAHSQMNYFLPLFTNWLYPLWDKRKEKYMQANCVVWPIKIAAFLYKVSSHSDNVAYIPNPLSFEMPKTIINKKLNNKIIIVGRFDDTIKRIDRALEMFKKLLNKNPNSQMIVVGNLDKKMTIFDKQETIGEMIDRLGFTEKQLIIVGEQKDVTKYYQDTSVLVMTSENEGLPMVLLEAQALGLPTVVFKFFGLEDIIKEGINGYIIPQDDVSLMADKVSMLLNDKNLYHKFSLNAQKNSIRFDIKTIGQKWVSLIDMLLQEDNQEKINEILAEDFKDFMDENQKNVKEIFGTYENSISNLLDEITVLNSNLILKTEPKIDQKVGLKIETKEYLRKVKNYIKRKISRN